MCDEVSKAIHIDLPRRTDIFLNQPGDPLFSVARLTEPGTFDLTKLAETEVPGLSIFLTLPGSGDPVERFDQMMETARALARELESEILDEKGSSWSVQRERYLREEIIEYRHQMERDAGI